MGFYNLIFPMLPLLCISVAIYFISNKLYLLYRFYERLLFKLKLTFFETIYTSIILYVSAVPHEIMYRYVGLKKKMALFGTKLENGPTQAACYTNTSIFNKVVREMKACTLSARSDIK